MSGMGKRELARVGDRRSTGKSRRAGTHATQRNPSFEPRQSTSLDWGRMFVSDHTRRAVDALGLTNPRQPKGNAIRTFRPSTSSKR